MISSITKKAEELVAAAGTDDPFRLSEYLGIDVCYFDLGRLKGYYTVIDGNRFIAINQDLDEYTRRLVCAHELGHDQLHRDIAEQKRAFQEFSLYQMKDKYEYEANVFASAILLPTDRMLEYIKEGDDAVMIAHKSCTDYNLVAIKGMTMLSEGYDINYQQFDPVFLK